MWNLSKILFLATLALGTILTISSNSWFGMWMGLEINLLSFIPIMKNKNKLATEAALKYFIVQAMASTILLFSVITIYLGKASFEPTKEMMILALNSSILLKMGAAPFHFWFPEVMEGLEWMKSLILLTWQKIAPMILFMYSNNSIFFSTVIIIACMVISGIMGQNQLSLKKIMAYSSINHIGWMIAAMTFSESIWLYYYVIYTIISLNIILMFKIMNIVFMKQLFLILSTNPLLKLTLMLNFLSLGGLPPFLGFMPKWMTIQTLVSESFYLLATIMVIMTLLTLFFYMRITFSTMTLTMNSLPNSLPKMENKFILISSNLLAILGLITITLSFNFL
uniref:NADH-ubiquinone oxidoreductase chain 2 n=1 Tax=Figulus binodulus TaxID=273949 RepID=A0A5J6KC62_9SCAR|nr:NADH dehydrogenase subunit 2 [Figulus binodulus]QEV84360.1 NADH dehydrogenase subunit 2 [Figulus binodulus]